MEAKTIRLLPAFPQKTTGAQRLVLIIPAAPLHHGTHYAVAVVNAVDPWAGRMVADCAARVVETGPERPGGARILGMDLAGSDLDWGGTAVRVPLVGTHNVENALCALAAAEALGVPREEAAAALAKAPGVPGRLQHFEADGVTVFVDYAHTDDALRRVLAVLRPLCPGRLHCVFGCGGDRDRGKRPLMARAAETRDAEFPS